MPILPARRMVITPGSSIFAVRSLQKAAGPSVRERSWPQRVQDEPLRTAEPGGGVPGGMAMRDEEKAAGMIDTDPNGQIPRTLHYVWFGGAAKPEVVQRCIASWRTYLPQHRIVEWNEGNFDVAAHPWMKRMHTGRRYAFASDYARLAVLKQHGGVYLDTDVELKKNPEALLRNGSVWSFEFDSFLSTCFMAAVPNHPLIDALLAEYDRLQDGVVNNAIVTPYFLRIYPEFRLDNTDQVVGGDIRVLPKEYFIVPSFDKSKNFGVHHATNLWGAGPRSSLPGKLLRMCLGDVLFFKLVNQRMEWRSEYRAMERARDRS